MATSGPAARPSGHGPEGRSRSPGFGRCSAVGPDPVARSRSCERRGRPPAPRRDSRGRADHKKVRPGRPLAPSQSRQNSLPSMSCITRHDSSTPSAGSSRTRTAPSATSRAHSASSTATRSSPTSPVPTRTSRCSRFLTTLPSGTRWTNSRGPPPDGSTQANAEPRRSSGRARSKSPHVAYPPAPAVRRSPTRRTRSERGARALRSRR